MGVGHGRQPVMGKGTLMRSHKSLVSEAYAGIWGFRAPETMGYPLDLAPPFAR